MATWVPESERTPLWHIFNDLYMCKVPVFQARTVEDIELFGTPASGDAEFDRTMQNERRTQYMTIRQMVELFQRGVTVGIIRSSDTKKIYETVSDHLRIWQETMLRSPNIRPDNEVLDDLVALDKFASAVHLHAQHYFTHDFVESLFARRMTEWSQSAIGLPASAEVELPMMAKPPEPLGEKKEWTPQPRESLADIFAARRTVKASSWHGRGRDGD
jgi:hypothetical protein